MTHEKEEQARRHETAGPWALDEDHPLTVETQMLTHLIGTLLELRRQR